ncbi:MULTISPECIES: bifunctional metallophosphatase/5'-nucleotidase [unclassified Acinetobacter]|uniref:bifunctional metallophosphatase/5'-nucleotidase n=1 Tax=unclassified Acinetobacter TaxID=196816 RepID=UPI001F4B115E|nr:MULTISPECIES: bifunctional metallophosphatase/5'-nucleotidase [unclassified Acinetobacter]MCH7350459.1 bifunctional metallophosphatase/5'-nucleotidase [Acinetobacter sp. NIPH 2023]MCH7357901.1 bifunctional metallophosphatase/5'-nucleotidase [Acinetobacter sp. NIPH 2024]
MTQQLLKANVLCLMILSLTACNDDNNDNEVPTPERKNQSINILAFNDFHGNLEPPKRFIEADDPSDSSKTVRVPVGGVSYFADAIKKLRSQYPNNAVVSAGDLISASPLTSSLFLDEPTIETMNDIQIDFNAVGNHEFDRGTDELRRLQNGGCQQFTSAKPCQINKEFPGAKFNFLAANVSMKADPNKTLFPAYKVKTYGGIPVAFIGMTLKATPSIVSAAGIKDVNFNDEADTVNALIPELKKQGIEAIVVVVHEGVAPSTKFNKKTCDGLSGPLLGILDRLDPAVDVVVSGHTHQSYICDYSTKNPQKPFLLTSAGQYGTAITNIQLELDGKTGNVIKKDAKQVPIQSEAYTSGSTTVNLTDLYEKFNKTPSIEAILNKYRQAVTTISARVVGTANGVINRNATESGESALGNLIADAQQAMALTASNQGSDFTLMNPGGVRADLLVNSSNQITFGDVFTVQPFGNSIVTLSLTGKQIREVLEQQWSGANTATVRILQPSKEFSYSYKKDNSTSPRASNILVAGQALNDTKVYRVTVNSFLADGGDNFTVLKEGKNPVGGGQDIDALEKYVSQYSPLTAPKTDRIKLLP